MLYINIAFPLVAGLLLFLAGGAARRGRWLEALQFALSAGIFIVVVIVANTPR